jgi:hypothetical protein
MDDNSAVESRPMTDKETLELLVSASTKNVPAPGSPKNQSAFKSKIKRAQTPSLTVFACLSWLVLGLLSFELCLHDLSGILETGHKSATARFEALINRRYASLWSNRQLKSLERHPLDGRLFEKHDECLTRAIIYADRQYFLVPYQSDPYVLNGTINWVEDNCARLSFTPQIRRPTANMLLRTFTKVEEKAFQVYRWTKDRSYSTVDWLTYMFHKKVLKATTKYKRTKRTHLSNAPTQLPPNFELDCSRPVCRLVYRSSSNTTFSQPTQQNVQTAQKQVRRLEKSIKGIRWAQFMIATLLSVFLPFGALLAMSTLLAVWFDLFPREQLANLYLKDYLRAPSQLSKKLSNVGLLQVRVIQAQLAQLFIRVICRPIMTLASGDTVAAKLARPMPTLGIGLLFVFLAKFVSVRQENVGRFIGAVKELYDIFIVQSEQPLTPSTGAERATLPKDQDNTTTNKLPQASETATSIKQVVRPQFRVSPTTTLQQDIEQELRLRREQREREDEDEDENEDEEETDSDYASSEEEDSSESDSDSDDDSDWSVV